MKNIDLNKWHNKLKILVESKAPIADLIYFLNEAMEEAQHVGFDRGCEWWERETQQRVTSN